MPESESEHPPTSSHPGTTDEHAFLRMEEGFEDWHVLSENKACCAGNPIHRRPKCTQKREGTKRECCSNEDTDRGFCLSAEEG